MAPSPAPRAGRRSAGTPGCPAGGPSRRAGTGRSPGAPTAADRPRSATARRPAPRRPARPTPASGCAGTRPAATGPRRTPPTAAPPAAAWPSAAQHRTGRGPRRTWAPHYLRTAAPRQHRMPVACRKTHSPHGAVRYSGTGMTATPRSRPPRDATPVRPHRGLPAPIFIRRDSAMRKIPHVTLLALGIAGALAFAPGAHAAGFQLKENSVKGQGMSFAGTAAKTGDSSVVTNNPAVMTQFEGNTFQVDVTAIDLNYEFEGTATDAFGQPMTGGNGGNAGAV